MTKTFVLLTEATLCCEFSTLQYDNNNEVVVPMAIYEDLYNYSGESERKRIARHFLDYCSRFNAYELSTTGALQENGSRLFILDNSNKYYDNSILTLTGLTTTDKRVFQVCKELQEKGKEVRLISQNPVLRHKAELLGIKAEPIRNSLFPSLQDQYKGYMSVEVNYEVIHYFKSCGNSGMEVEFIDNYQNYTWIENCFVTLKQAEGGSTVTGRYTNGKIVPFFFTHPLANKIKAENLEQRMLFEALLAPPDVAPLVIAKGSAGTGKTICSLAVGLDHLICKGSVNLYSQILIASPTVGMDDDIGFLPGDIESKVSPYLGGIMDNLKNIHRIANPRMDIKTILQACSSLFEEKFIEVQAIRYLRGRSIETTFFIIDEAQNIPVDIILDILTRAGKGTKIILMGDPSQINRVGLTESYNGLTFASEIMKGSSTTWQVSLNPDKNLRSDLSQEALIRIKR